MQWWGSKGIWSWDKSDNKWKYNNPQDVSQLCTKQVGTREISNNKEELGNRGNGGVQSKRTRRNNSKVLKNLLEVDLTGIGSLRCAFVSCCDTTALT